LGGGYGQSFSLCALGLTKRFYLAQSLMVLIDVVNVEPLPLLKVLIKLRLDANYIFKNLVNSFVE